VGTHQPQHDVAALVGNGLSIAFNPDLLISRINEAVKGRLDAAGDETTVPAKIMQGLAANISTGDPASDFEALLGPLDQYRDGFRMLRELASLAGQHNIVIHNALDLSADFVDDLRRFGVGHTLEVIAERSRAVYSPSRDRVEAFIKATVDAAGGGQVTIGNLNYDSLAMASLCDLFPGSKWCDMTDGRFPHEGDVVPQWSSTLAGRRLRRSVSDFPSDRRVVLVHLHGSLTWLRSPHDGQVYRFSIDDLRRSGYWRSWREGQSPWTPEVVLTNQSVKDSVVKNYPFSLAYEMFERRLLTADRWLICGYSFRDGCVNDMLARAYAKQFPVPQVMVVTLGAEPAEDRVLEALGYDAFRDPEPSGWLKIHRGGIASATDSREWQQWSDEVAPGAAVA
jgi:hypothetical protein